MVTKDSVVKIDSKILKEVENFISKEENRLRYINKKQFIDIAVDKLLKSEKVLTDNEENKKR